MFFKRSMELLGGKIDFVLHSIGMSPNVRKGKHYSEPRLHAMFDKTLDISALSFHKMLHVARKLDAINEWGSVVALSYIAAQRPRCTGTTIWPMHKALLESIARSFGYIYGRERRVRINTISQSPTLTKAGSGIKGMDKLLDLFGTHVAAGECQCAGMCRLLYHPVFRPFAQSYHAKPFPRRRFLEYGHECPCPPAIRERTG